MTVKEAEKSFATLVDKVHREGVSIDLERDNRVIARLSPVAPVSGSITIGLLQTFLAGLPSLDDDAEAFAEDVKDICKNAVAESMVK